MGLLAGNFLTLSTNCCVCFPYAGIFVSTDGRHVCHPRVYHQLRTHFSLSFLGPTLIPAAAALFSRSRSYIALLFLFRSPAVLGLALARAPGINRAAAPLVFYACLCIQGAPSRRISPGNAVLFAKQ